MKGRMDRELELIRQQRREAMRGEAVSDPGRRTNTDRMRPGADAGGGNSLYANKSPLASVGESTDSEVPMPAESAAAADDSAQPTPPSAARQEPGAAPAAAPKAAARPRGKQPAAGANAKDAPPSGQPPQAEHEPPAAAGAPPASPSTATPAATAPSHAAGAAGAQGGRGGRSGGGTGTGTSRGGRAPAAAVTHEVVQPAPSDPSLTRTTVGVGEEVTFTAPHAGNWRATSSTGTPSATSATTFRWKAPDTATNPTIVYSRDGEPDIDTNFRVVAPTTIDFRKTQDDAQLPAGVGMWTNLTFGPQTVNFYNAEWLEEPGGPSGATGYFDQYIREGHGTLDHEPNTEWTSMQGATNNGVDDHAFIAGKPRLRMFSGFGPLRWFEGSFEWSIPNKYRVAGTAGSHDITTTTQRFQMQGGANAGAMTVTKGGQSATQMPSGQMVDTSLDLTERFETPAAAREFLASFDGPVAAIKRGLGKLSNLRANDRTSYDNLIAALRAYTPAPVLYVAVRCTNTFSWFSADSVSLDVTGNLTHNEQFSLNTDRVKNLRIPWTSVIDPASFNSNLTMTYSLVADGNSFEISQPFPFNELGSPTDVPGSEGRYRVTSYLAAPT